MEVFQQVQCLKNMCKWTFLHNKVTFAKCLIVREIHFKLRKLTKIPFGMSISPNTNNVLWEMFLFRFFLELTPRKKRALQDLIDNYFIFILIGTRLSDYYCTFVTIFFNIKSLEDIFFMMVWRTTNLKMTVYLHETLEDIIH